MNEHGGAGVIDEELLAGAVLLAKCELLSAADFGILNWPSSAV
jgi:hypothetical protein